MNRVDAYRKCQGFVFKTKELSGSFVMCQRKIKLHKIVREFYISAV